MIYIIARGSKKDGTREYYTTGVSTDVWTADLRMAARCELNVAHYYVGHQRDRRIVKLRVKAAPALQGGSYIDSVRVILTAAGNEGGET